MTVEIRSRCPGATGFMCLKTPWSSAGRVTGGEKTLHDTCPFWKRAKPVSFCHESHTHTRSTRMKAPTAHRARRRTTETGTFLLPYMTKVDDSQERSKRAIASCTTLSSKGACSLFLKIRDGTSRKSNQGRTGAPLSQPVFLGVWGISC